MGIFDFLSKQKNASPVSPILPEQVYKVAEMQLRDIIAPSALGVQPKNLNLGTNIVRSYFVVSYPRFLTDNWLSPIINLDKVFDVTIHVNPLDTGDVMKGFQRKVAEVESQIMTREEKGLVRDPTLDVAFKDLEDLRDGLTQAQEKMFEVSLYLSIYGSSEAEVDKVENEIKNILESRLVYVKPALFQQDVGFLSTLPLGQDQLQIKNKLNTSPLSSFFPFVLLISHQIKGFSTASIATMDRLSFSIAFRLRTTTRSCLQNPVPAKATLPSLKYYARLCSIRKSSSSTQNENMSTWQNQ
jgi:conjugal transfer ATP-binding protein TraC